MTSASIPHRLQPKPLQPGGKIQLVAPARYAASAAIDDAAEALSAAGFTPVVTEGLAARDGQFGGSDAHRAAELNAAFRDPSIRAVWAMRGGYGCARLLPLLDAPAFAADPTWIIGFSDITALHAWADRQGAAALHAAVATTYARTENKEAMWSKLMAPAPASDQPAVVGGNLSVLYSLLGTPFFPEVTGRWLLLEDLDEYLYHVDRMLCAFRLAGVFERAHGLLMGTFSDLHDNTIASGQTADNPFSRSVPEMVAEHVPAGLPVVWDVPVGHGDRNEAVVLGVGGDLVCNLLNSQAKPQPMYGKLEGHLQQELAEIESAGLFKKERVIAGPQDAEITLTDGSKVLNFCANNYLGLSAHPRVVEAAKRAIDTHGFGMSSVRFICGTQDIHKELEQRIADFHQTEDTILYAAAFDANGGVFEPLLSAEDAIISDALNHASIIDGVRLCKAARYRYANNDMADLEAQLVAASAAGHRFKIIVTDGVFSMDGYVAEIGKICDLADKYDALVMVDECHATGFIGATGRGSVELRGALGRVDIITGTLGKAMGGAMGGFTTGRKEIIEMLRQRSRPYLFSNSLAPSIVGASIEVFKMLNETTELLDLLEDNTKYFKEGLRKLGLPFKDGESAIVPVMLGDAKLSQVMADRLLEKGIYVIGFFYPVVPKDQARIRVQLSAAHTREHLDRAIEAFGEVARELGVI